MDLDFRLEVSGKKVTLRKIPLVLEIILKYINYTQRCNEYVRLPVHFATTEGQKIRYTIRL